MFGLMMDCPLLISGLIEHAARFHGATEIVSQEPDHSRYRYDYAAGELRAKRAARALMRLGIRAGDRVATMAWNNHRHFELYYGISGIGAVTHTINPRLFAQQIEFIINHAEDRLICVDPSFVKILEQLHPKLPTVEHYIVMAPAASMPATSLPNVLCYETLLAEESPDLVWPQFDERTASSLCYTSGTTGRPKGALYSHRSTMLHAMAMTGAGQLALAATDSICAVVPMFHVNGWGVPYSAPLAGCKLVLPGQHLDGESVCNLFNDEGVTIAGGVPTVWLGALDYAERTGRGFGALQRLIVGGSAAPPALIEKYRERHGVTVLHAWGMTEMSPLGSVASLKLKHDGMPAAARDAARYSQGRPIFPTDLKIVGADGKPLPHDGVAIGDLHVRGPWVIAGYYNDPEATEQAFDDEGWFKTGDVCTIDPDGYLTITDRSKDVIKSGGEWISSIALENAAVGHPDVAEAAVIGVPHPKWAERPLLIVVPRLGATIDPAAIIDFLSTQFARWSLPDDVVTVTEIPHTATGKILKTRLRDDFRDYRLPTA